MQPTPQAVGGRWESDRAPTGPLIDRVLSVMAFHEKAGLRQVDFNLPKHGTDA
jgi:hypothetical protein